MKESFGLSELLNQVASEVTENDVSQAQALVSEGKKTQAVRVLRMIATNSK